MSVLIVGVGLLAGACASGNGSEDAAASDGGQAGADTGVVEGAAPEVSNAVAPFDHDSHIDAMWIQWQISEAVTEDIEDCMRRAGFTDRVPAREFPGRDAPALMSNVDFPDVDRLAAEGLPLSSESGASAESGEEWEPSSEWRDEWARCRGELPEGDQIHPAQGLFAHMRNAWLDVMGEIDETDEVQEGAAGFRDCLRDEGIPAERSADELQMLTYIDSLRLEADDREEANEVGVRYGKLYAECGRELFETRERLRGGERRVEFLEEDADAVRELSDLLYGN